jgi:hypothetical protein
MSHISTEFLPGHQVFDMLTMAQQEFFLHEVLFFHEPPESPIVGARGIGQVSAYKHKLHELPHGTSKGLFHFVQCKGSTKSHKINFSENNIQDMVLNPHVPQKEISKTCFILRKLLNEQFLQVGQRRISHATVPKTSPKVTSSTSLVSSMIYHVNHVFFFSR